MVFSNRATGTPSGSVIGKPRSFFDETVSSLATEVVKTGARTFFDGAGMVFNLLGLDDARRNLEHFRSGKGKTLIYTEEEMKDHPAINDAIDTNRTMFEGIFIGRTKKARLSRKTL